MAHRQSSPSRRGSRPATRRHGKRHLYCQKENEVRPAPLPTNRENPDMSSDSPSSKRDSIQVSKILFHFVHGIEESPLQFTGGEVKADLCAEGIDVDAAWGKAKKLLDAAAGRIALEKARKARLAFNASAAPKRETTESRETIIDHIRRLLAIEPLAAVYASKWEENDLASLISLRDQLVSTNERRRSR